jgi:Tfp pilus assembly protein PilV
MSLPSSGGGRNTNMLIGLAFLVLIALSVYSIVELSAAKSQIDSLQRQNQALQNNIFILQSDISSLQAQVNSLSKGGGSVASFYLGSLCISVNSGCAGSAYYIYLYDNGTTTVDAGYGISIEIKDATRKTLVGFNASLPGSLAPGHWQMLTSPNWPAGSNATNKLSPGDQVGVAVFVGSSESSAGTHVLTCGTYTTTTTFVNYTITTSATRTVQTCS